jgi:hypothetical protein
MTEVEASGSAGIDLEATRKALSSSSTATRLTYLHSLEDELKSNGV